MINQLHKILLIFFSVLPLTFGLLAVVADLYHDGYYIEATVTYGEGFRIPDGKYTIESSEVLPPEYNLEAEGDKVMLWGPPPLGTKVHLAMSDYYTYIARPTKISLDTLFDPYMNTKLFMKGLDKNMSLIGLVVTVGEVIFNGLSKKYEKRTIIHVYRINVISVKIISHLKTHQHNKKIQ